MAPRRRDLGSLSPRLLELSAKTTKVEPYPVTDKIVIRQTRKRRDDLHDAWSEIMSCQAKLQSLLKRANNTPEPEQPGDNATDEQVAAHEVAAAVWKSQMASMEAESAEINTAVSAATDRYNRAFFGDAHDDIMELSEDWAPEDFDAFKADVNEHFTQGVNPPPDGIDDDGQVVDEEEAGKAQSSST